MYYSNKSSIELHKLLIVVGSDGLESSIGVRLAEGQRQTSHFTGFPLIFKGRNLSVALLNQINLLLLDCAPEILLHKLAGISMAFSALHHHQILPQRAHIIAHLQRREIIDNCIAHTCVKEIYLLAFLDLIAGIAAMSTIRSTKGNLRSTMYNVRCTKNEKSLKSGDFSLFICICAKKAVPLHPVLKYYH